MKAYKLININDPNDQIPLSSTEEIEALYEGLEIVGYLVVTEDEAE